MLLRRNQPAKLRLVMLGEREEQAIAEEAWRAAEAVGAATTKKELRKVKTTPKKQVGGSVGSEEERLFFRLESSRSTPGSGLGLAIVRDLTERMGGSVTARRSSLGGAEFVVSFAPAPPPTP